MVAWESLRVQAHKDLETIANRDAVRQGVRADASADHGAQPDPAATGGRAAPGGARRAAGPRRRLRLRLGERPGKADAARDRDRAPALRGRRRLLVRAPVLAAPALHANRSDHRDPPSTRSPRTPSRRGSGRRWAGRCNSTATPAATPSSTAPGAGSACPSGPAASVSPCSGSRRMSRTRPASRWPQARRSARWSRTSRRCAARRTRWASTAPTTSRWGLARAVRGRCIPRTSTR